MPSDASADQRPMLIVLANPQISLDNEGTSRCMESCASVIPDCMSTYKALYMTNYVQLFETAGYLISCMDSEREHEGQKGCCGPHSSDATVQRLATSKFGSKTFLLLTVNKNIFVASFHVTQYTEPTHTTTLTLYFEISMLDV